MGNIEKLKEWPGDIWAINGAYHWAKAREIETTFIACDPHAVVADWAKNVKRAIVTTRCHPKVFEVLKSNGAEIKTFELDGDTKIISGSSTAICSVHIAFLSGYRDITYFGCESSYMPEYSHAYMHEIRDKELIVQVQGLGFVKPLPNVVSGLRGMAKPFRDGPCSTRLLRAERIWRGLNLPTARIGFELQTILDNGNGERHLGIFPRPRMTSASAAAAAAAAASASSATTEMRGHDARRARGDVRGLPTIRGSVACVDFSG